MLDQYEKQEVQKMIDLDVKRAFDKRIGDTPTDDLQLVNKKYCDANVPEAGFFGLVNSDGTSGTPFPTGWTSTRTAQGRYQIDHNLGSTNYVVLLTIADNAFFFFNLFARNTNDFQVRMVDVTNTFQDAAFNFALFEA